jgi:hypothetical protein
MDCLSIVSNNTAALDGSLFLQEVATTSHSSKGQGSAHNNRHLQEGKSSSGNITSKAFWPMCGAAYLNKKVADLHEYAKISSSKRNPARWPEYQEDHVLHNTECCHERSCTVEHADIVCSRSAVDACRRASHNPEDLCACKDKSAYWVDMIGPLAVV